MKIPSAESIEELANFRQDHELTDFEDQLEEVAELVFEPQPPLHPDPANETTEL
ncbi:MAG TPA: hypothetical protein VMW27_25400 [Thermoanaerobaculia bacterium]|nr:hypothetical protein [Thermoanaerobaculia bacterium]